MKNYYKSFLMRSEASNMFGLFEINCEQWITTLSMQLAEYISLSFTMKNGPETQLTTHYSSQAIKHSQGCSHMSRNKKGEVLENLFIKQKTSG